jgi:manganese oxidase
MMDPQIRFVKVGRPVGAGDMRETFVISPANSFSGLLPRVQLSLALAAVFVLALPATGAVGLDVLGLLGDDDRPTGCAEPNRSITLYAEELEPFEDGRTRLGYGTRPGEATTPGPLIEMVEGECLAVTLVNDVEEETLRELRDDPTTGSGDSSMPLGVSLHVHGVKYTPSSDGTFETLSHVPPGESRTAVWYAAPRTVKGSQVTSQGTAGAWWYHDHAVGTSHGTAGMNAGLVGGLVVRQATDARPDHTYTVVFGDDNAVNYRRFPLTDACDPDDPVPSNTCFVAEEGDDVEFLVIGIGDEFHTFHLHGHAWADNRTGRLAGPTDATPLVDNKTVGPGDTFAARVTAGELVPPGSWMMHCHVQDHSDAGMVTNFHVLPRGGGSIDDLPGGHEDHGGHDRGDEGGEDADHDDRDKEHEAHVGGEA